MNQSARSSGVVTLLSQLVGVEEQREHSLGRHCAHSLGTRADLALALYDLFSRMAQATGTQLPSAGPARRAAAWLQDTAQSYSRMCAQAFEHLTVAGRTGDSWSGTQWRHHKGRARNNRLLSGITCRTARARCTPPGVNSPPLLTPSLAVTTTARRPRAPLGVEGGRGHGRGRDRPTYSPNRPSG